MNQEPKQVIVVRKDLNMRKGKMISQGSHASMKVFFDICEKSEETSWDINEKEYTAAFWSDSGGLPLNKIKPGNRLARVFRES